MAETTEAPNISDPSSTPPPTLIVNGETSTTTRTSPTGARLSEPVSTSIAPTADATETDEKEDGSDDRDSSSMRTVSLGTAEEESPVSTPAPDTTTTEAEPVPAPESRTPSTRFSETLITRESAGSAKAVAFPAFPEEDIFEEASTEGPRSRSNSTESRRSQDSGAVDWSELEKTEEEEVRDDQTDESTAFLLARLEQENNALATDPRFGLKGRSRDQSRPPSIQVLKKLVNDPNHRVSRYSVLPNPPPMTELEFWAALVKDYPQTAQRLPTLTANKVKSGVPPPLRGVVWMSMVGARDTELGNQFDQLCQETSPYESLIGKDIGRSFPGVEMFRDANGEGQAMLGRVLRCFSLYDTEIGYCQGLGFLVGPLLMQMGDKDAFCVLVKLMENYNLRTCFLPNLSGLHVRIYQFQKLLDQHMPTLAAHLKSLGVEAAYLSQWFLSFFAVTCPLPMLFRIYDVIFAEGASETIMRVALSLMRRNEKKIMESREFEEVMQLLLSRTLWEPYDCNADDLVNDFMDMTGLVSHEKLKALETAFSAAHGGDPGAWFGFLPDATSAASRFLGRLWTATTPVKGTLAPHPAGQSRPSSFLTRSPSKQSIAASEKSSDFSSDGLNSATTVTTEATSVSRESSGDALSMTSKSESFSVGMTQSMSKGDRDLHGQIEDLLVALSDMQRQHAVLSTQLQKEREDRYEDHIAIGELIGRLRPVPAEDKPEDPVRPKSFHASKQSVASGDGDLRRRQTLAVSHGATETARTTAELDAAVERVNLRLELFRSIQQSRSSLVVETKQRLRDSLVRSKDQLKVEMGRSSTLSRQLDEQEKETEQVREQLRQAQARLQEGSKEKEKLEKNISELSGRASKRGSRVNSTIFADGSSPSTRRSDPLENRTSLSAGPNGLRELRLGRTGSIADASQLGVGSSLPKRTSSLATQAILATADHVPAAEDDLLVELVNAKTSEAMARQELEEVKGKLDAMRKMLGVPSPPPPLSTSPSSQPTYHRPSPSEPVASATVPVRQTSGGDKLLSPPPVTPSGISSLASGFWGWRRNASPTSTTPTAPLPTAAAVSSPEAALKS